MGPCVIERTETVARMVGVLPAQVGLHHFNASLADVILVDYHSSFSV